MSKYKTSPSAEVQNEAMKSAKATQRPGQTKEQTKLIAQGVQKGIEHYKKQHKAKTRELDKKLKKIKRPQTNSNSTPEKTINEALSNDHSNHFNLIPWGLLLLSWAGFILYCL
jgi:DUF2956 family protein